MRTTFRYSTSCIVSGSCKYRYSKYKYRYRCRCTSCGGLSSTAYLASSVAVASISKRYRCRS